MQSNELSLKNRKSYRIGMLLAMVAAVILAFLIGNAMGTIHIPFRRILEVIFHPDNTTESRTIWNIRLPRVILGGLVGINLALAGAILQGIMGNPLADPSIIGISSGAGLFGIFILVVLPQYQELVPLFAFLGAMLAAGIIYGLAWEGGIMPMRVVLAGVAVSALFQAGISGTMVFYADRVHGAITFMNGSLSARSWGEVQTILPYTVFGLIASYLLREKMNIMLLGDDVARGVGLHVERVRFVCTALAALMAASAVSVVGLLGFVGLVVPHSVRLLMGNDYKALVPGSALCGAALLMLSDTFARVVLSPTEIPVGIVMAVLGVPFFLYLLRR